MATSGPAIYFDGKSSTRHAVTLHLDPAALLVRGSEGQVLVRWAYDELEQSSAHEGVFRIGRAGSDTLERVEVRDAALAHAIDELSIPVDRTGLTARRGRRKVIFWSVAAVASLVLVAVYGVPEVATRLAPYVPHSAELKIGEAVDEQVRGMLNPGQQGQAFECGESEGKAAFDRLVGRLETAAVLPIPLKATVVRRPEANAIALPGGYIYVFQGLIDRARSADEVGGVIAHEIGHVARRDGMRSLLQAGGLAFVFGLVLGDFVGGGAVIIAAKTILQLSYSRQVEAQADLYAVELMEKAGGNPRALGDILLRIAGSDPDVKILTNHPATRERAAWIDAAARGTPTGSLLNPRQWLALQRICAGS
ncbi:MAG TPA: M48 family metallopeptidase [Xanthobacteraceae bacterium]|nr:M48 family metallopeptidase [Xanthobacteraceae bacterium]